ncbi:hypothetical protein U0070_003547 [Myodes glareolus]|uniref:Uncharacterized protein n=1 Tax=Myodes glareolus TaxID=447135 RepID=A0AAW0JTK8_MYOGA
MQLRKPWPNLLREWAESPKHFQSLEKDSWNGADESYKASTANSPKAKVRKTTTQAAMIASTGTPGTLSVGKANTGKSN